MANKQNAEAGFAGAPGSGANVEGETNSLGGVSLENAMLAAGFCMGLAQRYPLDIDENERKILKEAGRALRAAALKVWTSEKPPNAKLRSDGNKNYE